MNGYAQGYALRTVVSEHATAGGARRFIRRHRMTDVARIAPGAPNGSLARYVVTLPYAKGDEKSARVVGENRPAMR